MAKAPANPYKIRHVIICEDVRVENNGKEILIGVYNDVIIVRSLPFLLLRLIFRISVIVEKPARHFSFSLNPEHEGPIYNISGEADNLVQDEPGIIGLGFQNFTLPKAGLYIIHFGIDRDPEPIWDFRVRLPANETETARVRV